MRPFLNIDDYRLAAERRLPRVVFDYIDGGAESEQTVRANADAFAHVGLRPRGGVRADRVSLAVTVLGQRLALPVILGPCGGARVVRPGGDSAAARAAGNAGTAFVLSAMSGHDVAEVVAASTGPVWFQLYDLPDCEPIESVVHRATQAGVTALVVTIDTAAEAVRERDRRNGIAELLGPSRWRAIPPFLPLLTRPRWLSERIADGLVPPLANVRRADGTAAYLGGNFTPRSLTWSQLRTMRRLWDGPLVVKGVLTPDDARHALDEGATGVVVSNHGGRQLDGAESTLRALPEIVAAVGSECDVLVDGGVRRGTDVLKALAIGARAVLIARPWLYGLAADGERGVRAVLELLEDSLARNLVLLGCDRVVELSPRHVRVPVEWLTAPPPRVASQLDAEDVHATNSPQGP